MKVCTKCKETLPLDQFYKRSDTKDGLTQQCKACTLARVNAYKAENPDRVRESHRRADKKWREANREAAAKRRNRWCEANRTRQANNIRMWASQNRHRRNATEAKRRAQKRKATPLWANADAILAIYELAYSMSSDSEQYHVDHIVPLISEVVCGLHCEDNLQVLSAGENMAKSNKLTYNDSFTRNS